MKQASLGVLLIVAALLTACSSEDKAQPDAASREQPKTWKLCVQANKIDSTTTRGVHFVSDVLKSKWDANQTVEVYNESDELVGTLHAAASDDGSTIITGDISGSYTANTSKLYLYSPSKTRDYSGQTGTIESMSAKDYVSAEITVTAVDGSNGVLTTTTPAEFSRLQSFNKFTVTPAMHTLHVVAEGMSPVTTTLSGTTDGTEFYVALPSTGGSAKSFTFMGRTNDNVVYTCSKTKQLVDGNYYSGSITLQDPGLLPGKFSVASGKQVRFSQGNLRATYNSSSWTWSFAAHQWDYIGGRPGSSETQTGNNFINGNGTMSANGTVDLFGWSTSATTLGIHDSPDEYTYSGDFADWGDNSTVQSGIGTGWRTLTGDEWAYVFGTNSSNRRTTTSGFYYAMATVNDKAGVVLFPDSYSHPSGVTAVASANTAAAFTSNTWSGENWSAMESAGAVFLPAAGHRRECTVEVVGRWGYYWSATANGTSSAYVAYFGSVQTDVAGNTRRYNGYSVRLVRVAP